MLGLLQSSNYQKGAKNASSTIEPPKQFYVFDAPRRQVLDSEANHNFYGLIPTYQGADHELDGNHVSTVQSVGGRKEGFDPPLMLIFSGWGS